MTPLTPHLEIKTHYILTLSRSQALTLSSILGNIPSNTLKEQFGIMNNEDVEAMSDIYNLLPKREDS